MRKAILVFVLSLLLPATASAFVKSCWILTELAGIGSHLDKNFELEKDGFSGRSIQLIFNGNGAIASGDNIGLYQADNYAAVGAASSNIMSVSESYLVDPASKTVLYIKAQYGYGPFANMTGTVMFRGKAKRCG